MTTPTRRRAAFLVLLAGCLTTAAGAVCEERPDRVVSMNACTDQLAMLVAGEGQLHSVSELATDAGTSVMAREASRYLTNSGSAEEIFLMKPDLVLAGAFSARTSVDMLRRVGVRVEIFQPESTFAGVRSNILRMGEILGRPEKARELVAELDAGLAEIRTTPTTPRSVAVYSSNNYTSGPGSLAHAVIETAGLENIAERYGIAGIGKLPLEMLVMADPDLVVVGERNYGGPALAQQNFSHPAFEAVAGSGRLVHIPDRYWICGAPFTLEAVQMLRDAAEAAAEPRQ